MNRREFIGSLAAGSLLWPRHAPGAAFPVHFRKASPYELLARFILPGNDEFAGEKAAAETFAALRKSERGGRFYVLPDGVVRYEIARAGTDGLEYRVGLRQPNGERISETVAKAPRPLFRDITAELFGGCDSFREQMLRGIPYWRARLDSASGIDIYGNNGIAVGDCDNDGIDEVFVCQPGGLPNRLYKLRDGRIADITEQAGLGLLDDTSCALFLDLRNSGLQDLVVLRASGPLLYLNLGGGRFALRPDAFQFRNAPQGAFTGMSAADYDRDGRIDLYLCTYTYFQSEDQYRYPVPYHDARNGPPNFLLRNRLAADGSGAFEDVTRESGLDENNDRFSFAPAWCDYDGDGWPDLYVANDFGRHNLYKNSGGKFRDVAREAGVEDIGPGMSAAWFDFDGDGRPDLYVSNMWSDVGQRVSRDPAFRPARGAQLREAYRRHTKGNSLYRNRGDGTFEETAEAAMGRWAWSADGHDFDNDGVPEIFVTCGMLTGSNETDVMGFFWRQVVAKSPTTAERSVEYENGWNAINQYIREDYSWSGREPNVFYVRRDGRYVDYSGVSGLDCALDSRAFAVTDLDGDGNLDLLLKSRLGPQVKAFRNESTAGRKAIALRLTGTKSNRDAIGARVEVNGRVQFLQAGSGYISQHSKVLHFAAQAPANVSIVWPSGARQQIRALAPGFRYDITEGSDEVRKESFAPREVPVAAVDLRADNQPRTHDTWLLDPVPLPDKRKGPGLLYIGQGERPKALAHVEVVDLRKEPEDTAAAYALFRRYLFDWRTGLVLPLALLIDDRSRAHKIYATPPDDASLAADLKRMRQPNRQQLALPFAGDYFAVPRRNYFKLGAGFGNAGYPQQALPYLEEVVRQTPRNQVAVNAIGQIHADAGRLQEAKQWFQKAIALKPDDAAAINNLGVLYGQLGQANDAIAAFEYGIGKAPRDELLYLNLARVYTSKGDLAKAREVMVRLRDQRPDSSTATNALRELEGH